MTEHPSPALQVALAYHEAWTSKDFERAMTYISENIVCDAPAGRLEGAKAYRDFMGPFVQIVTRAHMIAAFGDQTTALVMYDTDTVPVKNAPGRVRDGQGRQDHLQPLRVRSGPLRSGTKRGDLTRSSRREWPAT